MFYNNVYLSTLSGMISCHFSGSSCHHLRGSETGIRCHLLGVNMAVASLYPPLIILLGITASGFLARIPEAKLIKSDDRMFGRDFVVFFYSRNDSQDLFNFERLPTGKKSADVNNLH